MNPDKLRQVRNILRQTPSGAIWLRHRSNLAWLTDGARPYIHLTTDTGVFALLVTEQSCLLLTHDVEAERLQQEEGLQDWQCISAPWHQPLPHPAQLLPNTVIASDLPDPGMPSVQEALLACRAPLSPLERQRYTELGHDASHALYTAAQAMRPGMSEHAMAGHIACAMHQVAALPVVTLVATDARIRGVRHPLPTRKTLERSAMLVVCAERHGLVASLTRFVCFGPPPADLERAVHDAARIDAVAIAATRPDTPLRDIWQRLTTAYETVGHKDSWRGLHQGGPCSYAPRDRFASADSPDHVHLYQAFAWNPSVPGGKSEDTLLVETDGLRILTRGPWPMHDVADDRNSTIPRPGVLRLD